MKDSCSSALSKPRSIRFCLFVNFMPFQILQNIQSKFNQRAKKDFLYRTVIIAWVDNIKAKMFRTVYLGHNSTLFDLNFLEANKTLPFPLTMSFYLKFIFGAVFSLVFVWGLSVRKNIFDYLKCPETKLGAINFIIWMDQTNGLCLASSIVLRTIAICSPMPLVDIIGPNGCELIALPVFIYLCGAVVWSAFIGFYR